MFARKFRVISAVLCVFCLLATSLPVAAIKEPQPVETTALVTTALVRSSPSSRSALVGQLENGTRLVVLDTLDSYYRIDCFGRSGYIAAHLVEERDDEYYVNCKEGDKQTASMTLQSVTDALQLRSQLMALATEQLGAPYIYGRSAPGGFDCSGFTSYLYRSVGITINRCADDQMQDGLIVPQESLQIGDLVFFRASGSPWLASHVGIYVGDGLMIHADSRGVRYDSVLEGHYGAQYVGARRILNTAVTASEITSVTTPVPMTRSINGLRTAG